MKTLSIVRTLSTPFLPLRRVLAPLALVLLVASGCDSMDPAREEPGGGQDQAPPSVSITSPVANASIGGTALIEATATDDNEVAKVEFYIDGALAGTSTTSPWAYSWNTLEAGDGAHTLQAKAYDAAGNQGVSATVAVTAKNGFAITFRNTTRTSVTVNPSGQSARTVGAGNSVTFSYELNPGRVTYSASTKGRYGKTVRWSNESVSAAGKTSASVSLQVSDRVFFLRLRNSSSRSTSSLYVNYKRSDEVEVKPFSLGKSWTDIGYFQGYSQSRIRIYSKYQFGDLGPVWWEWTENISSYTVVQFTLANGVQAAKQGEDGTALDVVEEPAEAPHDDAEGVTHYGEIAD